MKLTACTGCGGAMPEGLRSDAKYCSRRCSAATRATGYRRAKGAQARRVYAQCGWCRQESGGNKYCSPTCTNKAAGRARNGATRRGQRLNWLYGISEADVALMLFDQNGCAICHRQVPTSSGWAIDHDHACCAGVKSCGLCVRGVLCSPCNQALGLLGDSSDTLMSAIAYLVVHETVKLHD